MIVVQLIGGLGNQMFQYAAGRALALSRNVPLLLDLSYLNKNTEGKYTPRKFELDCFNIDAGIATPSDLSVFNDAGKIRRVIQRIFPGLASNSTFYESGQNFHANFFRLSDSTRLIGFWQSEKYFSDFREIIRKDFTLKNDLPAEAKNILKQIDSSNSVSLHVRRGDYVALKTAADFHGTCDPDYYRIAFQAISQKVSQPELFIFSDDISWCKKEIRFDCPMHFIEPDDPCVDMYLMSKCKHNIIANSSFSWWGAWLNSNENKIVIAPKKWFKDESATADDLIPFAWLKI